MSMPKIPEDKFLDDLEKIIQTHKRELGTENIAILMLGQIAAMLVDNGLDPMEIIGAVLAQTEIENQDKVLN